MHLVAHHGHTKKMRSLSWSWDFCLHWCYTYNHNQKRGRARPCPTPTRLASTSTQPQLLLQLHNINITDHDNNNFDTDTQAQVQIQTTAPSYRVIELFMSLLLLYQVEVLLEFKKKFIHHSVGQKLRSQSFDSCQLPAATPKHYCLVCLRLFNVFSE